jgi:hypothetical protein
MYIHVCTMFRHVCTVLPILVQVVRIPDVQKKIKKMNNSHGPSLRWRRRGEAAPSGEAASWLHHDWKGKVCSIARFRVCLVYPASRFSGRGPAGLGKPKLLLRLFLRRICKLEKDQLEPAPAAARAGAGVARGIIMMMP